MNAVLATRRQNAFLHLCLSCKFLIDTHHNIMATQTFSPCLIFPFVCYPTHNDETALHLFTFLSCMIIANGSQKYTQNRFFLKFISIFRAIFPTCNFIVHVSDHFLIITYNNRKVYEPMTNDDAHIRSTSTHCHALKNRLID